MLHTLTAIAAGGALGALFLTSAMMTSKGNALLVMPIVFGGAVSVTALYSVFVKFKGQPIDAKLWLGMALVVVGVVLVAKNTPHGHGAKKPAEEGHTAAPAEVESGESGPVEADGAADGAEA